jgi:AraC-like DNA-binding protein
MSKIRQQFMPDEQGDNRDASLPVIAVAHDRPDTFTAPAHTHFRAQLVYASDGVMRVSTESATWIVPPQQAVWVPADITHAVINEGEVAFRTLYLHPDVTRKLPGSCCVVSVPPLLRELILYAVAQTGRPSDKKLDLQILKIIPELLRTLEPEPLQLPLPQDRRLQIITDRLMDDPSDSRSLPDWANLVGASQRTVERLFKQQLGMNFVHWRQRLRLLSAVSHLSEGMPVTTVSYELGYASPSAFIAMFRRALGCTPGRYLRERKDAARDLDLNQGMPKL